MIGSTEMIGYTTNAPDVGCAALLDNLRDENRQGFIPLRIGGRRIIVMSSVNAPILDVVSPSPRPNGRQSGKTLCYPREMSFVFFVES